MQILHPSPSDLSSASHYCRVFSIRTSLVITSFPGCHIFSQQLSILRRNWNPLRLCHIQDIEVDTATVPRSSTVSCLLPLALFTPNLPPLHEAGAFGALRELSSHVFPEGRGSVVEELIIAMIPEDIALLLAPAGRTGCFSLQQFSSTSRGSSSPD